ncbi:MAG: TraB/GumN family protein [Gammaproteobacteria bacterium]
MKRLLLLGFLCLALGMPALALPLWELEGTDNRIRLLGSVHFLRARDYPLPAAIMTAYADADIVVFELDMSAIDPLATQNLLQRLALDPGGNDLEDYLGARNYRSAATLAKSIDIDLATLRSYEPWFAALQITQLRLAQLGFDGSYGIETRLTMQAVADAKTIRGLESMAEQLGSLDSLPAPAQRVFLMRTLEDAAEIEDDLDDIVTAWREGDTQTLEKELLHGLEDQTELHDRILIKRNRNWAKQILGFTKTGKRYLVIVGALHLVGDDSVIRMLDDAGYPARQIR